MPGGLDDFRREFDACSIEKAAEEAGTVTSSDSKKSSPRRLARATRRNSLTPGGMDEFRAELGEPQTQPSDSGDERSSSTSDKVGARRTVKSSNRGARRNSVMPDGLDEFRAELDALDASSEGTVSGPRRAKKPAKKGSRRNSVMPGGLDEFRAEMEVRIGLPLSLPFGVPSGPYLSHYLSCLRFLVRRVRLTKFDAWRSEVRRKGRVGTV